MDALKEFVDGVEATAQQREAQRTERRVDDRRCRVTGAKWHESTDPCVKIEGARRIGERAVLLAGAADPRFIAQHREILPAVATVIALQLIAG